MFASRGEMSVHSLFRAEDLGLSREANLDRLVKVFLQISEGIASRWVVMSKGMLLLVTVPGNPASGAIYLYDRVSQDFSLVCFEGADDRLTPVEFDRLLDEYQLVDLCCQPASLCRIQRLATD